MTEIRRPFPPVTPRPVSSLPTPRSDQHGATPTSSFAGYLQKELQAPQPLAFSAHAQQRLAARNIQLDKHDVAQLEEAVAQVKAKGGRDSLILSNKAAFVVSVKNNMVVTAMDRENLKQNVFTNIDSAIII